MLPRHEGGVQADVAVLIPPDDVVARRQHESLSLAAGNGDDYFSLWCGYAAEGFLRGSAIGPRGGLLRQ